MKPAVYIETTIISYLTARATRDPITAGWIDLTKKWWSEERPRFEIYVSDVVLREASQGDAEAVRRRIRVLQGLAPIRSESKAQVLADAFLRNLAMPANAADDALHVAVAAVNELNYLLTWNCRHIANAEIRPKLEGLCLAAGYRCPIICTPPELTEPR